MTSIRAHLKGEPCIGSFALGSFLALSSWLWCSLASAEALKPPPRAAELVGYVKLTFHTDKFDNNNIDLLGSYKSGYSWYLSNFFGKATPASTVSILQDGSISAHNPHDSSNAGLSTVGAISSAPYFVGTAFGCGAYISAEISFNADEVTNRPGQPSVWAMSVEHLIGKGEQWPGQEPGFMHFGELDIFEYKRNRDRRSYGFNLHDWFGRFQKDCPFWCRVDSGDGVGRIEVPGGTRWTDYHQVAVLWVPARGATPGYATSYFDGLPGLTVSWTEYIANQAAPPITPKTPWAFGVIDKQHLGLLFGSGSGAIKVRSFEVWQDDHACNISN